jgi:hypothetical protein
VSEHVLGFRLLEGMISEVHDPVANHDAFKVYILSGLIVVIGQDQVRDVWDVLARVALPSNLRSQLLYEEGPFSEFWGLVEEEIFDSCESISCSLFISPFVFGIFLSRKSNYSWRLQK